MKKILLLLSVLFLTFGCYDDSDIRSELRDHEERIAQLETLCKQMNTNISALQTIVSTLQKNVFVTAVIPIKEGSDIVGYTISFSNSESVTIYHGRDGVDGENGTDGADGVNGATPSIGVRQDIDGIYYWTLDGEWLLDATGKKVQAVGRDGSDGAAGEDGSAGSDGEDGEKGQDGKDGVDGKTPQLKIENGYWYVSYDGEKWTQLGKATGESANLIGITQDDKNVYFTLTDGTVISIPKGNGGSQDDEEGGAEDGSQTISKGPITLSLGEVTATTATFTARLDIDMMADYQEVGLVYSKDDDMDVESETITKVKINKESYSETFIGLQYDTDFYYTVYTLRNNVYSYGATQTFKTKDVTISVDDVNVTNTTATFVGKVVRDEADASVKVGIQYSAASSFESTSSLEVTPEEDGAYSVACDGLYHAKEYFYRTYVCQDGVYEYGDVMTFTTNAVSVELKVESNTQTTVQFGGKIDPSTAIDEVQIAVLINTSETVTKSDYSKKYTLTPEDIKEDGSFDVSMSGLKFGTTYYYTYYVLNNSAYSYGTIQNFKTEDVPVNLSVGEITQTAATISGNISLTEKNVLEVGLLYSSSSDPKVTTSGVNKVILTDIIDADGNFTYKAENLLNETPHYYRYYIKQGSTYTYSEVSTFKTERVPVTIEVESIDKNVVTFKGNVQFSEPGVIEIGVQYYPKSTTSQSAGIQTKAITEISENGDFIVEISGLLLGTEYYWQYYLLQNDVTIVGLLQTFEIADLYNVQSYLNMSSASDLSSYASANCYIISESGLYKFKTVKGNSSESVGSVASASILWETFGTSTSPDYLELIDGVCYKDGYIAFQTADTFKEGNAVIAVRDDSGNVLWSWHIWFTDQPEAHVYKNNAGTMMDRNLGATSATPGDVGALGLLYQWGRKDPFLGSSSISETVVAKSTLTWPAAVETSSSVGTVDYVTANPTTFVTADSFSYFDWHYSSRDNTLWTTSDKTKSIYDPCPAGWRVPDGGSNGIWSKAIGSSSSYNGTYDNANEGMNFSGKFGSASTIWYPASGYRNDYDGSPFDVGNYGYYWSASPYSHHAYYLYFNNRGYVNPSSNNKRATGLSVRCLQVIDEVAGANAEESK